MVVILAALAGYGLLIVGVLTELQRIGATAGIAVIVAGMPVALSVQAWACWRHARRAPPRISIGR